MNTYTNVLRVEITFSSSFVFRLSRKPGSHCCDCLANRIKNWYRGKHQQQARKARHEIINPSKLCRHAMSSFGEKGKTKTTKPQAPLLYYSLLVPPVPQIYMHMCIKIELVIDVPPGSLSNVD